MKNKIKKKDTIEFPHQLPTDLITQHITPTFTECEFFTREMTDEMTDEMTGEKSRQKKVKEIIQNLMLLCSQGNHSFTKYKNKVQCVKFNLSRMNDLCQMLKLKNEDLIDHFKAFKRYYNFTHQEALNQLVKTSNIPRIKFVRKLNLSFFRHDLIKLMEKALENFNFNEYNTEDLPKKVRIATLVLTKTVPTEEETSNLSFITDFEADISFIIDKDKNTFYESRTFRHPSRIFIRKLRFDTIAKIDNQIIKKLTNDDYLLKRPILVDGQSPRMSSTRVFLMPHASFIY